MKIKKIIAGALVGTALLTSSGALCVSAGGFTDVKNGQWYTSAVEYCISRRYMEGTSDTTFSPDAFLTRAEAAVMMHALDNSPTYEYDDPEQAEDYPFTDLVRGEWFTAPAVWCYNRGILSGYNNGAFGVNDEISREGFILALYRLADYKGYDIDSRASLEKFKDTDYISPYAVEAMQWAVSKGIIAGSAMPNGSLYLNPGYRITRAEAATILRSFSVNLSVKLFEKTHNGKFVLMGGSGKGHSDQSDVIEEIFNLAGKEHPNMLYIGYAQKDPTGDYWWAKNVFGDGYGCNCDLLTEEDAKDSEVASEKIAKADIFYVGGGDTVRLVGILKKYGLDSMLHKAAERGAVMAGTSAGAICFCESGESSVAPFFMRIDGIGCLNVLYCPHALEEEARYNMLIGETESTPYMSAVAMDGAALEVVNGQFRMIKYAHEYKAEICRWVDGEFKVTQISSEWKPLSELVDCK